MNDVNPEALNWIKSKRVADFAVNRFDYKTDAILFVNKIYSKGAVEVLINSKSIQVEDNELYADAIIVKLPIDLPKREDTLKFCQTASPPGCYVEVEDDLIRLWWD